jgi:hypothetical protein
MGFVRFAKYGYVRRKQKAESPGHVGTAEALALSVDGGPARAPSDGFAAANGRTPDRAGGDSVIARAAASGTACPPPSRHRGWPPPTGASRHVVGEKNSAFFRKEDTSDWPRKIRTVPLAR